MVASLHHCITAVVTVPAQLPAGKALCVPSTLGSPAQPWTRSWGSVTRLSFLDLLHPLPPLQPVTGLLFGSTCPPASPPPHPERALGAQTPDCPLPWVASASAW